MDKEVIATGKTWEEALDAACEKIGVSRENVDFEILEMPKKKFFGLKSIPAKVKVTVQDEYINKFAPRENKKAEKKQPKEQPQKHYAPEAKAEKQPAKQEKIVKQEKPAGSEQPRKEKAKQQKTQQPQQPQQKKEQLKKEVKEAPVAEQPIEKAEETKTLDPAVLDLKGGEAAAYIKEILVALGHTDADVTYSQKDGMIVLQLSGENMGAVVGRRGDNLDALQYLASLVANRSEGSYVRVVLDVDDYRSKREASLRAYARKMAIQAVKNQRAITLEAMNPYERRIVHSTVQTVSGATSKSAGSEPNRRVVISPVGGGRSRRDDGKRRFDGNKKGGRGGRDRNQKRESQKVVAPQNGEPPKNDTSAISLYGRIDLD